MAASAARASLALSVALAAALLGACGAAERTIADEAYLRLALDQSRRLTDRSAEAVAGGVKDPKVLAALDAFAAQRREQAAELSEIAGDEIPGAAPLEADAEALGVTAAALSPGIPAALVEGPNPREAALLARLTSWVDAAQATDAARSRLTLPELRAFAARRAASDRALARRLRVLMPTAAER